MSNEITLLVKHAVTGKMLLDSRKEPVRHTLDSLPDGGYEFRIAVTDLDKAQRILSLKDELNVFIFEAFEGQPVVKHWYYVKDGNVQYHEAKQCLMIQTASRISYLPSDYYACGSCV